MELYPTPFVWKHPVTSSRSAAVKWPASARLSLLALGPEQDSRRIRGLKSARLTGVFSANQRKQSRRPGALLLHVRIHGTGRLIHRRAHPTPVSLALDSYSKSEGAPIGSVICRTGFPLKPVNGSSECPSRFSPGHRGFVPVSRVSRGAHRNRRPHCASDLRLGHSR
jgi:hypothetical protein